MHVPPYLRLFFSVRILLAALLLCLLHFHRGHGHLQRQQRQSFTLALELLRAAQCHDRESSAERERIVKLTLLFGAQLRRPNAIRLSMIALHDA
jgi:hypothetical protein